MTEKNSAFPVEKVWQRLDPKRIYQGDWIQFRHRQQGEFLHELAKYAPFDIGLSHIGLSDEGRVLHTLRFGKGDRRVMVWARQHGDEADCTAALCMALSELILYSEEPQYARILSRLELGVLPMVNPDGVARFQRRNAQGIDLNRDAVALTSQEAQALMQIKESLNPEFCFNLHDMNPRKSTPGGDLVALAFQAGPFEKRDIDNETRLKAKKLCGLMAELAREHAPKGIARYTADYMHRAFGDSMMRMGVASILIEAGGWHEEQGGDDFVRRLFALCLLRGLYAVAEGEDQPASGELYDSIPFDSGKFFTDLILEKCHVLNGTGRPPFRADVALNVDLVCRRPHDPLTMVSRLENLGDLEDDLTKKRLPLEGQLLMPGFLAIAPSLRFSRDIPSAEEGAHFLDAGITAIAVGFGPFESQRARERWIERTAEKAPPLNIIGFERVGGLRDIFLRHGMTELAGLLVHDLMISPEDLLDFTHLFHPAHHSAIEADHSGKMIGIDLFFQGAASPGDTHLHLHLTHVDGQSGHAPVRAEELRLLVDQFLRDPSQITLSQDAADPAFDWLPIMIGFGGLSHGRMPMEQFLGNILTASRAQEVSDLVAAMNMMTLTNARAFKLANLGKIEIGQRADLVAFDQERLRKTASPELKKPTLVMLNGRIVVDAATQTRQPGEGTWYLAARPQVR
jgi:hypothetical protein